MSQLFSKYPLVQKVYDDQVAIAATLNSVLKPEYTNFLLSAVDVVDAYIDGTAAEKENAMVACILLTAISQTFDDVRRFDEYPQPIKELIKTCMSGDMAACRENALFVQATYTIELVSNGTMINELRAGNIPENFSLRGLQARATAYSMDQTPVPPVLTETAPRLAALYIAGKEMLPVVVDNLRDRPAFKEKMKKPAAPAPKL